MNKIIILLAISFIVITGITGIIKPKIYKPVRFAKANMGIENVNQEIVNTKSPIIEDNKVEISEIEIKPQIQKTEIKDQTIKLQPQKNQIQQKQIKTETQKPQEAKKTITIEQPKTKVQNKTIVQPKEQNKINLPKSVQEIVNSAQKDNIQTVQKQPEIKKEQPVKTPQQIVKDEPKTVLTEEEEIILWNKWRSDLQNQVMRDARVAAPMGTRFRFSFTVDKFGNISNLRVWSDTPYFTPLAVSSIKPVLLSYQGKNILKFPKGTKRIQTNVTGGFVISTYDKYSKPDDYADVEKIRRLKNVQM